MRFLYWVLVAIVAIVLVLFAVSNRGEASLGLWPLPFVMGVPLYLLVLLSLVLGFVVGRLAGLVAAAGRRRELRRRRRRIEALERELATTQARLTAETPPARLPASG
jgi:lipopolysaccharide assembly protein A